MANFVNIAEKSDSLIDLLAAQCADLEQLLGLARAETAAAEQKNFEAVLEIVSERSRLGERLETFQRRIAELRGSLGAQSDNPAGGAIARRTEQLAAGILAQDRLSQRLLTSARQEAAEQLSQLQSSQGKLSTYLSGYRKGLAYSREF
jgi:flagellar biosynthesis/type III secretory pathway chaperone